MTGNRRHWRLGTAAALAGALALAFLPAGCGGGDGGPAAPGGGNVALEGDRRQAAVLGPAGGQVAATSRGGVTFTLEVPPGALTGEVEVAVTPVAAITGLPPGAALVAAVQFEPSGTRLVAPAMLTVAGTVAPGDGRRVIGFGYEDDTGSVEPTAALAAGGSLVVPVFHFSGAGALSVPQDDPSYESCDNQEADIAWQILCVAPAAPENRDRFLEVARRYLNDIVVPHVRGDTGLPLRDAVIDYWLRWLEFIDHFGPQYGAADWDEVLDADMVAAETMLAGRLGERIGELKAQLCQPSPALETLIALFEFDWLAQAAYLYEVEHGLSREQVLDGICAEVVVERVDLPDPLPLDQDVSVDVKARLDLGPAGGAVVYDVPLQVNLLGNLDFGGANSLARCCGRANGAGEFTTVARRTSEASAYVEATAVLMLPLFSPEGGVTLATTPLSGSATAWRGKVTVEALLPPVLEPGVPAELFVAAVTEAEGGDQLPLADALVAITVAGGSVTPVQLFTDGTGSAAASVTAAAGAGEVVVDVTVSVEGIEVGRKEVRATVADASAGLITVLSRRSTAHAWAGAISQCDPVNDFTESLAIGATTVSAGAEQSCRLEDPETGYVESVDTSAFINQTSAVEIAADARSAAMTFGASGAAESVAEGVGNAMIAARTTTDVEFEVMGAAVSFQLDGSFEAVGDGTIVVELQKEGSGIVWEWDKQYGDSVPSTVLVAGSLAPGRYRGQVTLGGRAVSGTLPGTSFGATVTLTLGPWAGPPGIAAGAAD